MELKYRTLTDRAKGVTHVDQEKGIVCGYLAAFNEADQEGLILCPGAFLKTIAANGPLSAKPRITYDLGINHPVLLGKLIALSEDSYGLYYESQIIKNTRGLEFLNQHAKGEFYGTGIRYSIVRSEDNQETGTKNVLEVRLNSGNMLLQIEKVPRSLQPFLKAIQSSTKRLLSGKASEQDIERALLLAQNTNRFLEAKRIFEDSDKVDPD
jgi:phage head maturation protease